MNIEIKVTGPGACILTEVEMIHALFKEHGFNVTVVDHSYPERHLDVCMPHEQVISGAAQLTDITIIADHRPWGG